MWLSNLALDSVSARTINVTPTFHTNVGNTSETFVVTLSSPPVSHTPMLVKLRTCCHTDWIEEYPWSNQAWDLPFQFELDQEIPYLETQLHDYTHSAVQQNINQLFSLHFPPGFEASPADSNAQSSTSSSDSANTLTPSLQTCPDCGSKMSSQRLKKHQRTACNLNFSCKDGNDSGCHLVFRHKKDQQRHWEQVCSKAGKLLNPFECCCKEEVRGWDRFMRHQRRCAGIKEPEAASLFSCFCGTPFETLSALQSHHNSTHKRRPGRPRKNACAKTTERVL
ncbi:hypothetical protein B0J13DRAFT_521919 [Dactylonectria estremocensis]|uniref:Uncharacterized protein n=1 Tax=Dactylonectria estremocensis TaxID=1079267 RepID=A0A9P9F5E1_9HYPO|nr:hypothetical protein B0J13DRAFT_521919 [Dactylonectria estremocensis]